MEAVVVLGKVVDLRVVIGGFAVTVVIDVGVLVSGGIHSGLRALVLAMATALELRGWSRRHSQG